MERPRGLIAAWVCACCAQRRRPAVALTKPDRALIVTPAPLGAADGWRDGWCATCVDDGWAAIDVEGPDAPSALAQGTSADPAAGSPSAAVLFAGFGCLVARTDAGFRLHVEAPWLEALLTWLDGA